MENAALISAASALLEPLRTQMTKQIILAAAVCALAGCALPIRAAHGGSNSPSGTLQFCVLSSFTVPAHGDALTTVSAWQLLDTSARAAEIVCARHLAKDAPPGTDGLIWEPAFQEPCSDLHTRLEAVEFGAERLAGDGVVADREILRQAGLPVPPH